MSTLPYLATVIDADVSYQEQPFAKPLVLSSGSISQITEATARVRVRVGDKEAEGFGCIYLSDLWSWPDPARSHAVRDEAMRKYSSGLSAVMRKLGANPAHPLDIGMQLHAYLQQDAAPPSVVHPPLLARLVCASPLDAALHDAVGKALGRNAMQLYDVPHPIPAIDGLFGRTAGAATSAIDGMLVTPPRTTCRGYWIVGKKDDLNADVRPAIKKHGYHAFKLKTHGQSAEDDAAWTVSVYQFAKKAGAKDIKLCIDSNTGNPDAQSVMAYLDAVQRLDKAAYDAIEIVEQPTARDIAAIPFDWHAVAKRKCVVVDEGLVSIESMHTARAQGWNGFAIKTCKGHSFALVAAAYARRNDMSVCIQDLTNPGIAAIQSAMLAAWLNSPSGIELNSLQFTPAANAAAEAALPGLFNVKDGLHTLPGAKVVGLGSSLVIK